MRRAAPLLAALGLACATPAPQVAFGALSPAQLQAPPPSLLAPGKISIVAVFASWSDGAKVALPRLSRLAQEAGGAIALRLVAVDEDQRFVAPFLAELHVAATPLPDPGADVARGLGVRTVPAVLVVDAAGAVSGAFAGHGIDVAQRTEELCRRLLGVRP
jgi:thiol-disulfide isomerase/thioredoxin